MSTSTTKTSAPKLSDLTKHVVAPKGMTSTGWPAVRSKCLELGIRFRPWQPDVGRLILAKRADGKYAATIGGTGLSISRQVGKTFIVGAIVFALCLLRPNLTVIWTAHRLRTSEETFKKMLAMSRRKRIAPHMLRPVLGSGEEAIRFRNGSRILFGARERGFGRGFDEVDVLIFDEAQILTDAALDDMIPATNQSRQETGALLLFMGTPPKPKDPGEVFTRMRTEALSGEGEDTGWIEFGADDDYEPPPITDPLTEADWRQVAKANPSFPDDTPREAILRMRKNLGPDSFRREGLGIWDKVEVVSSVISPGTWLKLANLDPPEQHIPPSSLAVDMSHDRVIAIAGCWRDGDDSYVELLAIDRTNDTLAAVEWISSRAGRRIPVVIDSISPAASMIPNLKARKVRVIVTTSGDMGRACGGFYDDAMTGRLTHANQDQLNTALAGAKQRRIGDAGGWGWDRKDVETNIAPLVSVTLARFGGVAASKPKLSGSYAF